ncbi:MAG: carboxypeptidase-like regulatory domain-containing protein, partial [Planctomycetes bacterium]|nr:carboxypeptidase-like regulatory domain-containing protein [Planctomycetota bacterium]
MMLTHGQRGELTLLGAADDGPRLELAFTAATESGGNAPGAVVRGQAIRMVLGGGAGDLEMRPGLHPFVVFQDRLGAVDATPTADTAGPNLTYTLGGGNGTIQLSGALFEYMVADKPAADATAAPSPLGAIAGVVYGEDGKPVPKVLVALLGTSPQPLQRAQTDDHGSYHFDNLQPGDYTVRAGGDRDGLATAPATVTTGTTPTDVQLRRDACVRGRAVDSHDQPFANATVQWDALDGSWSDATTTGDDGTFVLANLPGGPGRLLLFPPQQTKMPIAVAAAVLPDTGKTVLRAPTGSSLQLTTVKPSELAAVPYNQLTIRVWQTATDLGLRLQRPGKGDLWQLDHLPAGDYEVELRFPGGGRRDLGRHWLDGEHAQDLGRVELPRGGHLQVALTTDQLPTADNERAIEIASLRRDADVRLTPAPDP